MDCLRLKDLAVDCIIGDRPEERTREQRLTLNVTLSMDLAAAARTDELADTVDYADLSVRIRAALRAAECRLVERAAEIAALTCLENARVREARVCVRKAGCVPGLGAAEVEIVRGSTTDETLVSCET